MSYTPAYISYDNALLKAFEKLTGFKAASFVGDGDRVTLLLDMLDSGQAALTEDVVSLIADSLGFARMRPMAGRVRALIGATEVAAAPLTGSDGIAGFLAVLGSGNLTPDDLPFVSALAAQLSYAWQLSRTGDSTDDEADLLRLVAQISSESVSMSDIDSLEDSTLRWLQAALPGYYVAIGLVKDNYVVFKAKSEDMLRTASDEQELSNESWR